MIDDDFLVLVNAWWQPLDFTVPTTRDGLTWQTAIDTHDPARPATAAPLHAGDRTTVNPRSITVLCGPLSRRRPTRMTDPKRTLRDCKKNNGVTPIKEVAPDD